MSTSLDLAAPRLLLVSQWVELTAVREAEEPSLHITAVQDDTAVHSSKSAQGTAVIPVPTAVKGRWGEGFHSGCYSYIQHQHPRR